MVDRIISGGQTGADRAALDFALQHGIECGGWVPRGRMAEDGIIPAIYPNLIETETADLSVRTEFNVRDSDATLLLTHGIPTGGSALTNEIAKHLGKPLLHIDLNYIPLKLASKNLGHWLQEVRPKILNVAGSRNSKDPEIYKLSKMLLESAFLKRKT